MATTSQSYETIANNISALARESAIILEKGQSVKETVKSVSNFTEDEIFYLGNSINKFYKHKRIPVLFLSGDVSEMTKEVKVPLSFKYEGISGTLQCKWQGNYTVNYPKKNFSLTKLSPGLDLGWGTQKKYVTKAEWVDGTLSKNTCAAKLWGKIVKSRTGTDAIITKLKTCPNGGAIDGFPIILILNDEFYGVCNFNIPKDKWMMNMGEGAFEVILPCEAAINAARFKGTITKQNLLDEKGFSIEYITSDDQTDTLVANLNTAINFCITNQNNSSFKDELSNYIDIDSAIDYYIYSCLLSNWDGVNHNYILSSYDGVKFFFTAYDLDHTFENRSDINFSNLANGHNIFNLFYKYDKDTLKQRYYDLRKSVMSEENVFYTFQEYQNRIPYSAIKEESAKWGRINLNNYSPLSGIISNYKNVCARCDAEIAEWGPTSFSVSSPQVTQGDEF